MCQILRPRAEETPAIGDRRSVARSGRKARLAVLLLPLIGLALGPAEGLNAANRLSVEHRTVMAGETGAAIPVRLDIDEPVLAIQLSLATDERFLAIRDLSFAGSAIQEPEFSSGVVLENGRRISWGLVLDLSEPFVDRVILPGENLLLGTLIVDVPAETENVVAVRFADFPDPLLPSKNALVAGAGGAELTFSTFDAAITIDVPPDVEFLRGDSNEDGRLDLSDGIFTLNFLFLGGTAPPCGDSADADDTGKLELTDAIYTFNYLFLGGPSPPLPFPDPGPDPTADGLGCRGAGE